MLKPETVVHEGDKLVLCYEGSPHHIVEATTVDKFYITAGGTIFHLDGSPKNKTHYAEGNYSLTEITEETRKEVEAESIRESLSSGGLDGLSYEKLKRIEAIVYED